MLKVVRARRNKHMSTPFLEALETRVAFLERESRRTAVIIDNLEMRNDQRLKQIDEHLETQDKRLDTLDRHLATQDEHLATQDKHLEAQDEHLAVLDKHLDTQDANLHKFANETNARFDRLEQSTDARFDAVDARFDAVDEKFVSVDKKFEHVYGILADIKSDTIDIRNVLAMLVEKLERK
jgi:archaellum component FlaC